MDQQVSIRIREIVGSACCVASDDGQRVHDEVASALREGKGVRLSFANVDSLTSAFLNAAIGQLYAEFSEDQVRRGLSVSDMSPDDLVLLKRVVETAKEYFKDPQRFSAAGREVLGEEDDDHDSSH